MSLPSLSRSAIFKSYTSSWTIVAGFIIPRHLISFCDLNLSKTPFALPIRVTLMLAINIGNDIEGYVLCRTFGHSLFLRPFLSFSDHHVSQWIETLPSRLPNHIDRTFPYNNRDK